MYIRTPLYEVVPPCGCRDHTNRHEYKGINICARSYLHLKTAFIFVINSDLCIISERLAFFLKHLMYHIYNIDVWSMDAPDAWIGKK